MLPELFDLCEKNSIPATFFELTSTLAFAAFKRANCEAIVVEVGLGGRLDSTNIITPTLSIITSIQLDHVKILGDTKEKIAAEKAGNIITSNLINWDYSTNDIAEAVAFYSTLTTLNMPISQSLLLSFLPPLSLSAF